MSRRPPAPAPALHARRRVLRHLGALACAAAFAPVLLLPSSASAQNDLNSQTTNLLKRFQGIFVIVRNVLFGLSGFGLLVIGGAALMGRFNAKWLWTIGGAVVLMAISGFVVNELVTPTTTDTTMGAGVIKNTP